MAQTVQNVTLSLTLPITCHICLGKVMGTGWETGAEGPVPAGAGRGRVLGGDGAGGAPPGGEAEG